MKNDSKLTRESGISDCQSNNPVSSSDSNHSKAQADPECDDGGLTIGRRKIRKSDGESQPSVRETTRLEPERSQVDSMVYLERIVMPLLLKLKSRVGPDARMYLDLLERCIFRATSHRGPVLKGSYDLLTPREAEVCNMIRCGLSTKEIASIQGVTEGAIRYHRKNVRRKLGIANTEIHLSNHLLVEG